MKTILFLGLVVSSLICGCRNTKKNSATTEFYGTNYVYFDSSQKTFSYTSDDLNSYEKVKPSCSCAQIKSFDKDQGLINLEVETSSSSGTTNFSLLCYKDNKIAEVKRFSIMKGHSRCFLLKTRFNKDDLKDNHLEVLFFILGKHDKGETKLVIGENEIKHSSKNTGNESVIYNSLINKNLLQGAITRLKITNGDNTYKKSIVYIEE